jgi:hypothetical protein
MSPVADPIAAPMPIASGNQALVLQMDGFIGFPPAGSDCAPLHGKPETTASNKRDGRSRPL